MSSSELSVGIIGTGIIGLACALELHQRGACVTLYQSQYPPPASLAAAGMLGPGFELGTQASFHPGLAELCLCSARLWPDFAAALKSQSGLDPHLECSGTIACLSDQMDEPALARLTRIATEHGLEGSPLSPQQAGAKEPALHIQQDALYLPGDIQIDPPAIMLALRKTLERSGVCFRPTDPVREIERRADERLCVTGHAHHDALLFATGAAARFPLRLDGQETRLVPEGAVFPVKGDMLALAKTADAPRHVIRSGPVYIVPKPDRILVGATSRKGVDNTDIDSAALDRLQQAATGLCPGLGGAQRLGQWSGIRPGSVDHAPFLGTGPARHLYVATGHYRNGILLAPVSARIMADTILQDKPPALAKYSGVERDFADSQICLHRLEDR